MPKAVRISLANKCQLLFGFAVVLIIAAALAVVWLRMHMLVELGPQRRAEDFAQAWLDEKLELAGQLTPMYRMLGEPEPEELQLTLIGKEDFDIAAQRDPWLGKVIEQFETNASKQTAFVKTTDAEGHPYYRYVRAIRKSFLARGGSGAFALQQTVDAPMLADPVEMVLVLHLRDRYAEMQATLNRIYIIAAGLFAMLLAIGVFWFITRRIILSPVRVLTDVARQVSRGDLRIRSEINTGDEFEQLSDMFNTMLARIKEGQDELRKSNRSLDLKLGELAEHNVALFEANKIKGEFLANVSHELRTPLHSIIGFAEVLEETIADRTGPVDEKRKRYVRNIITSSRRLLDLINDLLDLAKIEAGRIDLNVEPMSVSDTVEGLINLIRPQANKREIELVVKVPRDLPMVETDPGKVQQIVFNFLANAVKFTPEGGTITLQVKLVNIGDESPVRSGMRFAVTDTGPGIAPEDQQKIFEKFTQLDATVTREHGGTGLGLTICRDLAKLLQGEIDVESTPGEGATFALTIPLMIEDQDEPLMPNLVEGSSA